MCCVDKLFQNYPQDIFNYLIVIAYKGTYQFKTIDRSNCDGYKTHFITDYYTVRVFL